AGPGSGWGGTPLPLQRVPSVCHVLPFQHASPLTVAVPAWLKSPAANKPRYGGSVALMPLCTARSYTRAFMPWPPLGGEKSVDQLRHWAEAVGAARSAAAA